MTFSDVGSPLKEGGSYYWTTTLLIGQSLSGSQGMGCNTGYSQGKYSFTLTEQPSGTLRYRPIIKLKNSVKLVEGENDLLDIVEK